MWDNKIKLVKYVIATALIALLSVMAGCPQYNVWQQELKGRAELSRAGENRKIKVEEARAKAESAVLEAEAEVARARGVAEANKIIGDSLKENESYLRYLWITEVAGNDTCKTTVYIPTEANMPLLEAGRTPVEELK